jgi:hypothetical protein
MALTADRPRSTETHGIGVAVPLAADAVVYKGGIYGVNAAGYLVHPSDSAVALPGVAVTGADNTGGAAGDKSAVLMIDGIEHLAAGGYAQADVGSVVEASDDDALDNATGTLPVGVLVGLAPDGKAKVLIGATPVVAPT